MGTSIAGAWMVGGGCANIRYVLYRGISGGTSIQVVDVGHVPVDWENAGSISPLDGNEIYGEYATEELGWDMYVTSHVGGNGRGGHAGGGDLRSPPSEHCCIIYHDKAHYEPVSGGSAAPRSPGFKVVVGTGGTKSRGDTGGVSVGGGKEGLGIVSERRETVIDRDG